MVMVMVRIKHNTTEERCKTSAQEKNSGKVPEPRTAARTLCEPALSKCTSTFHKSHSIQKFTGKMRRPSISPERRHTLCANLRSRNARQHFTRPTLYRNLQEKAREWAEPLSVDTLSGEKQKRGSRDSSWNSPTTVGMEIQATKKVALSNKKDCYNITNDDGDKWSVIMAPTQM